MATGRIRLSGGLSAKQLYFGQRSRIMVGGVCTIGLRRSVPMDYSASIFFLTVLMIIGLGFFIRAASKDRTQVVTLVSIQSGDPLLAALKQYFADRAYQVDQVDAASNKVTLSGQVRPSVFLTVFVSLLAAVGGLCFSLLLTMALPQLPATIALVFLALAPGAGWLYWRKAGRTEQVAFVLDETTPRASGSLLKVSAHRDELLALQQALNLTVQE
jgi:Cofactor assembly of complex C subunit B